MQILGTKAWLKEVIG